MARNEDTVNISDENKNLDISVIGEFRNLEVVEEVNENHDNKLDHQDVISAVARPQNTAPVFGTVSVSNSDNVQFGNNTYFQGPVIIKQIIQSKSVDGIDNAAYTKTESEIPKTKENAYQNEATSDKQPDCFGLKKWQKIAISAILFVIASTCGVIFGMRGTFIAPMENEDESLGAPVAGTCFDNTHITKMIVMVVAPLISISTYFVLTINIRVPLDWKWLCTSYPTSTKCKPHMPKRGNKRQGNENELLIAPDHLRVVSRTEWLAQPETGVLSDLKLPAPWVIISHTATDFCYNQSSCVLNVRLIQSFHVESRGWFDIGYNFLVGGDGSAYYGRGWDYEGAHTLHYNRYSIGIAFIGTFTKEAPPQKQIDACLKLIKRGVAAGKIAKDYKLFAHRQLMSTQSPGDKLFDIMKEWPNFVKDPTDIDKLLPNY